MSEEKFDAKVDQASGKVKETIGKVTGDKRTEAEGKSLNAAGKAKEIFDDAKAGVENAFNDAKDSAEGAIDGLKNAFDKNDDK